MAVNDFIIHQQESKTKPTTKKKIFPFYKSIMIFVLEISREVLVAMVEYL